MKNSLFTLILICLIALNNNVFAHQSAVWDSSVQVSVAAKSTVAATKAAPSKPTTRKSKTVATVIAQPKHGYDSHLYSTKRRVTDFADIL